jgi:DNA-binding transcriptional LysR family regulator
VSQKLQQMGVAENELNTVMVLGSTTAVKRAVESGAGVSIVSERAVRREIDLGSVRKLRLDGPDLDRDFLIVYRSGRTLPPAVAALLNFFNERNADL